MALRRLLRTKMLLKGDTRSGIRDRLLFIRTGEALCDKSGQNNLRCQRWLRRLSPEKPDEKPPQSAVVQDIEVTLAAYRQVKGK